MANFSVESQVLYYVNPNIKTNYSDKEKHFMVDSDALPHIINPVEAKLGSHASLNPTLNFIVYVPKRAESPLVMYGKDGKPSTTNGFLSPRWGGMLVYNVNHSNPNEEINMEAVMEVFVSHLRQLFGVSVARRYEYPVAPLDQSGFHDWEVDQMLRSSALENLLTSVNTVHSLSKLLEKIGNIVINDNVGALVFRSVSEIQMCYDSLGAGSLIDGFAHSREAAITSEQAFFDPSLLELLYFPEDQKFAIYVPLFVPISIPVFLSLKSAVQWMRSRQKCKQE